MPSDTIAPSQPCILAMDTATGPCSVAVWKGSRVEAYVENAKPVMQSASLVPMIEQALKESGTRYADLTGIAATTGPGSFTGIRVALAAARAIAFAGNIPCMGYTTLQVLAFSAMGAHAGQTLAILNAGKGEHYWQLYHNQPWQPEGEPSLGMLQDIIAALPGKAYGLAGNAVIGDTRFGTASTTFPRADVLAQLAATHPQLASAVLRPFYIRPPDAKLPQSKIG